MHPDSTKTDVAKAILQGLRSGQTNASDLPVATWKQVFWQRLQHLSLLAEFHGVAQLSLSQVRFAYDSNSFEEAVAADVVTPAPVAEATSGYGGSTT